MSSRTSSRSTLTTVPSTMSPSLKYLMVSSIAARNASSEPRSSTVTLLLFALEVASMLLVIWVVAPVGGMSVTLRARGPSPDRARRRMMGHGMKDDREPAPCRGAQTHECTVQPTLRNTTWSNPPPDPIHRSGHMVTAYGGVMEAGGTAGVVRRSVTTVESTRASRAWWDGDADAYQAEHGAFLGDVDFVWCPEGLREADAHLLGDVRGARILEVGCGAAACSRWLATQGAYAVATDLSAGMLRHARAGNARARAAGGGSRPGGGADPTAAGTTAAGTTAAGTTAAGTTAAGTTAAGTTAAGTTAAGTTAAR